MSVELPRGEEPVSVVIEKKGYLPQRARLAPARTENHTFTLKESRTFTTKFHPSRTKKKKPPAKATSDGDSKKPKKGDFDEVPDWMKNKDAKSP